MRHLVDAAGGRFSLAETSSAGSPGSAAGLETWRRDSIPALPPSAEGRRRGSSPDGIVEDAVLSVNAKRAVHLSCPLGVRVGLMNYHGWQVLSFYG